MQSSDCPLACAKLKKNCNKVHLTESRSGRFPLSCTGYQNQGLLTLQRAPLSYSVPFIILSSCLKATHLTLGNAIEIVGSQNYSRFPQLGSTAKSYLAAT